MLIKLIALHEGAVVPTRFNIDDVCADLYAVEPVILMPGQSGVKVDFGLILHPDCYKNLAALKVYIRSGLASKGIMLTNGVGIIEPHFAGYEKPDGSIAGITGLLTLPSGRQFLNGDSDVSLKTFVRGDRVCQLEAIAADGRMVPSSEANYEIVERLTTAQWRKRFFSGRSGFGSTGGGAGGALPGVTVAKGGTEGGTGGAQGGGWSVKQGASQVKLGGSGGGAWGLNSNKPKGVQ